MDQFAAIVEENANLLREYHTALHDRDMKKIEEMRDSFVRRH